MRLVLYPISRYIFKVFFTLFFDLKIIGLRNRPKKGPYIIACNHVSYIDPPIAGSAGPIQARFIAQEDLFKKKGFFGWWMKNVGCIPTGRGKRDLKAIKTALDYLSKGGVLMLFPEGTRSDDGRLKEAKLGVGLLAHKAGVPIVPGYIKGTRHVLPKHAKSLKRNPIRIYLGRCIEISDFKRGKGTRGDYEKIGRIVMNKITELKVRHGD